MENPWIGFALTLAIALGAAAALMVLAAIVTALVNRRFKTFAPLAHATRNAFRALVLLVAVWVAVAVALPPLPWPNVYDALVHVLRILGIVFGAWLLAKIVLFLEDLGLSRIDAPDAGEARRIRTQVLLIRRLTIVVFVILAAGAVLLTFDGVQAVGASVLASAGLVSVVAGLAAQSTLANLFAGMQLAFSGAIRVEDVVVVEGEWGRIEEITLTYVVVHIWDDRRLVLPSTYFTTTPFTNWTRRGSDLLGTVYLDVDWRVSPEQLRAELDRILEATELWDGRAKSVQVTDATGGHIQVRVLVSAADGGTLWSLRVHVREQLVLWLQNGAGPALPRTRVELVGEQTGSPTQADSLG